MNNFRAAWWGRFVVLVLMGLGVYQTVVGGPLYLIDGVNLVFHEAGHVIFFVFGQFLQVLGGTFMQLLIPAFVGAVFFARRNAFGAAFSLWWLGTNLMGVSLYMADSRVRRLELIGDLHDWAYLFGRLGLSSYDTAIAGIVGFSGFLILLAGVVFGAVVLWRQRRVGHGNNDYLT